MIAPSARLLWLLARCRPLIGNLPAWQTHWPKNETFIRRIVRSGRFNDQSEVVRNALLRMEDVTIAILRRVAHARAGRKSTQKPAD
jgi:putative addiction module CopG family antidote